MTFMKFRNIIHFSVTNNLINIVHLFATKFTNVVHRFHQEILNIVHSIFQSIHGRCDFQMI